MIRDVTGLNEARDGTMPDKQSLVGLQKLAAANSNVATRHILNASLFLTLRACENISLRVADSIQFDLLRESLIDSISLYNVKTLEEIQNLHLYDFGIYLEIEPDEEAKASLEQNIQVALQQQSIGLPDAIEIREIKNLKLANKLLKLKQEQKAEKDQQNNLANIKAQADANAQASERAAMAEVQKQQALAQTTLQIEQGKSQFELQRMQSETELKKQLIQLQYGFDKELKSMEVQAMKDKEALIEDRKDERTKIQATQQSQLIQQRQDGTLPTNFEMPND
tara:strand:- start:13 stop:855 length:843 start_codon:yes stop_codon:yes gene_type:complete